MQPSGPLLFILGVTYVCTHVCVGLKEKAVAACICTQGAIGSREEGTEVDFKQDLPQKGPVAGDDDSISVPYHEKLPAKKSVTESGKQSWLGPLDLAFPVC